MFGAIWAENLDRVIGDGVGMPWHVPEDLRHFKEITVGQPIIMGRRTWEALPVRPLPGRRNFVLSTRSPGQWSAGAEVITQLPPHGWIIGGGEVFAATLGHVSVIERTLIDASSDLGDRAVYAPEIPPDFLCEYESDWLISRTGTAYQFQTWRRME